MKTPRYLFVLAAIVIYSFLATKPSLITGDDGTYIALAQSLRAGEYKAINVPGDPVQVQYPPLFPILLTPVAFAPLGLIRLYVALLAFVAFFSVARAARIRDPETGAWAALLFACSALYGEYASTVLTETAFIGLSYAILCRASERTRFDWPVALGLVAALLLRTSAIALVAAMLLHYLLARQWRALLLTSIIITIGMSPWWAWQMMHESNYLASHILQADIYNPGSGMISPIELITQRIPHNLSRYTGRIVADVMTVPWLRDVAPWTPLFPLKIGASLLLTLVIIRGFWKKRFGLEEKYVLLSLGLFSVHPVFADRYLFALLPSLTGYLLLAFNSALVRRRVAFSLAIFSLVGCILSLEATLPKEEIAYFQAIDWIKEHSSPGQTVAARKPSAVWYHAGLKASGYEGASSADYIIRDDYTIGIHAAERYLDPILADSSTFVPVFVSGILPDVKVYERRR